ncbi:unnamed protein product, partial [Mesorhabditis belari]|uniref:Uncharacterized protein n=1 Tax=Mesorhabditis belari TaxID=2138241 RepID=A0AAF3EGJ5_9BILA
MIDTAVRPVRWSAFGNNSASPTTIEVVSADRLPLSFSKPSGEMLNRDDQPDFSSAVLAGLVALLVLLAAVVWIAFCLALHRTAKRISEIKRQRRRQVLIANAIHHALADNRFAGNQAAMPAYLASLSPTMTQQLAADLELRDLPSYEQAVRMGSSPVSPVPEPSSIAPSRRGSATTPIQPPPYTEDPPIQARITRHSRSIPTISGIVDETQESNV